MRDNNTLVVPFAEFEVKSGATQEEGIVTGYAAIYGSRDDGRLHDLLMPGTFRKALQGEDANNIVYLPSHDYGVHVADIPAVPLVVKEDRNGLYTETKFFLNTQRGRDSYTVLSEYQKAGRPMGLSMTFKPVVWEMKGAGRVVTEAQLREYGHTAIPMHPDARDTGRKSAMLDDENAFDLKAYYSDKEMKFLIEQGQAMEVKTGDGSYQDSTCVAIVTPDDLFKAIYGMQMGAYADDAKAFIVSRAKTMSMDDALPRGFTARASSKALNDVGEEIEIVVKEDEEVTPKVATTNWSAQLQHMQMLA